jgi:calcium/calmodulin-dependent protein kinase I
MYLDINLNMNELEKEEYHDKFSDFYVYIGVLGSGSFGKVIHAIDRLTGEEVAVKVIEKKTVKRSKIIKLKKEAEILGSLDHPNIVKFIHLKETDKRIFLAMELVIRGSLQQYLKSNRLTEVQAASIMKGVLKAVEYIHSKNIIHRDIKPENILIPSFKDFSLIKLADFGLSTQFEHYLSQYTETGQCGTLKYMAPEQTSQKFYSKPVDIWSCGIIVYVLITRKHPLTNSNETSASYILKLSNPQWQFPENFSEPARDLFLKLVKMAPLERYTASEALSHPWVSRQGTKPPLTSFEKFKKYGEHLKLKGIIFPIFFMCTVGLEKLQLLENKVEDFIKKPPIPSGPKIKIFNNSHRFLTTPGPDSNTSNPLKKPKSPRIEQNLLRKLTPKEFIRRKSNLRPASKSFQRTLK